MPLGFSASSLVSLHTAGAAAKLPQLIAQHMKENETLVSLYLNIPTKDSATVVFITRAWHRLHLFDFQLFLFLIIAL